MVRCLANVMIEVGSMGAADLLMAFCMTEFHRHSVSCVVTTVKTVSIHIIGDHLGKDLYDIRSLPAGLFFVFSDSW